MKIYLLRPVENLKDNDNPWKPWYDRCFGFVVRAENEQSARQQANSNGWCETDDYKVWLDKKYSTCEEIPENGIEEIIIQDNHSA